MYIYIIQIYIYISVIYIYINKLYIKYHFMEESVSSVINCSFQNF